MFSQTGSLRRYIRGPCCEIIVVKRLFQGHNDLLPSSGTEPRLDNLAVANLRSFPLSCTAVSWDNSIKCPSQRHNSNMPSVGIEQVTLRFLFAALTN